MRTVESYPISYLRNGGPDRGSTGWFIADMSGGYYEDKEAPDITDGFSIPEDKRLIQYVDYDLGRGRRTIYFEVKSAVAATITVTLRMMRHSASYTTGVPTFEIYAYELFTVAVNPTDNEWVAVVERLNMAYPNNPGGGQEFDFVFEIHSTKTLSVRKIGIAEGYHGNPVYWGDPFINTIPQGAVVLSPQEDVLQGFEKVEAYGIIHNSLGVAPAHSDWPSDLEYDANDEVGTWCSDAALNAMSPAHVRHRYRATIGPVSFGNTSRTSYFESEDVLTINAVSLKAINDLHQARRGSGNIYAEQNAAVGGEHTHALEAAYINIYYRRLFLWKKL